jgi:hypothetical protein
MKHSVTRRADNAIDANSCVDRLPVAVRTLDANSSLGAAPKDDTMTGKFSALERQLRDKESRRIH